MAKIYEVYVVFTVIWWHEDQLSCKFIGIRNVTDFFIRRAKISSSIAELLNSYARVKMSLAISRYRCPLIFIIIFFKKHQVNAQIAEKE